MMQMMRYLLLLPLLLSSAAAAVAGDVARGAEKSGVCVQCHGASGNAPIANYPKLGGQYEKYLLYALHAYKNGKRDNPIMAAQIAELTDEDIADLSAYYAAQAGDLR